MEATLLFGLHVSTYRRTQSHCDVRLSPNSGHVQCNSVCPLRANSGHQLSSLGCSLIRHPLSEVCLALTASTTMRMAWMTTWALSIMMLCPECVSVMCTAPGTSAASSF